jgi:hydroxyacylglutathione hydrolase
MTKRREFLQRAALGAGALFLPYSGAIRAGQPEGATIKNVPGLIFEKFEAGGIVHYSYLLGDAFSGAAVVIDPKRDVDDYIEFAQKNRLTITHAIETHVHADFVSGSRELARRTGAEILASGEGDVDYGFSLRTLRDGAEIKVGSIRLKAVHTPGHTPEHMSYLASTGGKPNQYWALFTGDFIFPGSVGRPDLMGVEKTEELSKLLYKSLQTSFNDLPDALPIYPAHGPGSPCGAGILKREGVPTLGLERRSNPAFQFKDEGAFIKDLLFSQPPVPYYWPRMKRTNARGPEVLVNLPEPLPLKPAEFKALAGRPDIQLLDTRNMLGFGGGHIKAAVSIGHSPSISMWAGWLFDPKKPVALVLPPQGQARDVVAWLARVGITNFAGVLDGGMDAWVQAGQPFETIDQVSVHDLRKRIGSSDLQLVDVRQPSEWDHGHIPGARYMFLPEIPKRMLELDRSKPVMVYCGTGYRASIAASLLKRGGFNVSNVPGSFGGWLAAGYGVIVPPQIGKASDTRRA